MFDRVIDLLHFAKEKGVEIILNGDQLQVKLPKDVVIDSKLLEEVRSNKPEIIDFLKTYRREAAANAITRFDRPAISHIPLSFSQERLWFIDKLEGSVQYHIPVVLRLTGRLNLAALQASLQAIVDRHEVLRTVFLEKDGQPYQHIKTTGDWKLQQKEVSTMTADVLQQYIRQLVSQPYNLSADYMLRADLLQLGDREHVLVATIHHIAADGWSMSVIVKELVDLYSAFDKGTTPVVGALDIQYADYAVWQRGYLQGEVLNRKMSYWKDKLHDVAPLQLPTDYPRPQLQSTKGSIEGFAIGKDLATSLLSLSKQHDVTLFMTLLAAFKVLLYRYTGQHDICVGTPTANRTQKEVEELVGFFVNMLALRTEVRGNESFVDLLASVKATTMAAYEHQEVPFEKIVETVMNERDLSRSPLFQALFVLQNTPEVQEFRLGEMALKNTTPKADTSKFDLSFYLVQTPEGLQGAVEYSTDLFSLRTIQQVIGHYQQLLEAIVQQPMQQVDLLNMLTPPEVGQLVSDFNDTAVSYDTPMNVVALFEAQAAARPGETAVVFEDRSVSYKELNERANQHARYLTQKGVGKETLVPICIERGVDMIISLLAVLKAGAAFVPVDPDYPLDRIAYMIDDVDPQVLITNTKAQLKLNTRQQVHAIELDRVTDEINALDSANPGISVAANDLIYVIYTSGSTGKPKGVMIEHGSVVNLLKSVADEVSFTSNSTMLSVTTFSFDISYLEFFMPLITGGKLVIASREVATDGYLLKDMLAKEAATHMQGTPATWQLLLDAGWRNIYKLKALIGGEAVREDIKNHLTDRGDVFNVYGPTETTIWSAIQKLDYNEKVVIGKPVANTAFYILSRRLGLMPILVPGEICIAGTGLARGYYQREELTAEKFVEVDIAGQGTIRLYRTGDLGRWLPNGNLECLGRFDQQIKIRGYRVELGEIETLMQQHEAVAQAAVVLKESSEGDKRLISYYVPRWEAFEAREKQFYQSQVADWKEIYEAEYEGSEAIISDEKFDIVLWKDSFTGEQMSEHSMREWLNDITSTILQQQPQNVLEIGCGSGLICYALEGKVNRYVGTDFSVAAVRRLQRANATNPNAAFHLCAAHDIGSLKDESFDTIILNSVVQYFPGTDYLAGVLKEAVSLLKGKGTIVIGDVRDYRLLALFKGRLQLQKLNKLVNLRDLKWQVQQDVLKEEELCIAPEYFAAIQQEIPGITHIAFTWKKVEQVNELSAYRYTVLIHVGDNKAVQSGDYIDWKSVSVANDVFRQMATATPVVALSGMPNPRLWKERLLHEIFEQQTASNAGEVAQRLAEKDPEMVLAEQVLKAASEQGYQCTLLLNPDPFKMDVLLQLRDVEAMAAANINKFQTGRRVLANIPLFAEVSAAIQKDIRDFFHTGLPEYMVPSDFVPLPELPLTNNGKIDRKYLSDKEERTVRSFNYQPPRNNIEYQLVTIWKELLNADVVGVTDNFFEIGGHSLLAMRVIAAIRKHFEVDVSIRELFVNATIEDLGKLLIEKDKGLLVPSLTIQERPADIPLSFSQSRLYFVDRLEGTVQYHMPFVLRLKGRLIIKALVQALQTIVSRHEVLRTILVEKHGEVYQQVKEVDNWTVEMLRNPAFQDSEVVQDTVQHLITKPFDLYGDDMIRASLLEVSAHEHVLVVTMHHISSDGWSISVIVREFAELYESYAGNLPLKLAPLPVQFADYAIWQRSHFTEERLNTSLNYWKHKLEDVAPLQLPTDFPRSLTPASKGAFTVFYIDEQTSTQLRDLSQQEGVTLFMTLLAAFNVLMYRYSNQSDICVGSPVANRGYKEVENLIGFFVNTVTMRSAVDPSQSFLNFLQQVRDTALEAYEHQEVPFEKVVEAVVKQRYMSQNPIFQVTFALQNTPEIQRLLLNEVELSAESMIHQFSRFDIAFALTDTPNGLMGMVEYNTQLFTDRTLNQMIGNYCELLKSVLKNPSQQLGSLSLLTMPELQDLTANYNNTVEVFEERHSVVHAFKNAAQTNPTAIALRDDRHDLTYRQVDQQSDQLAKLLIANGVRNESVVPVCIQRSPALIVAMLGILKAGGAYVPVDPEYPADRIAFMLSDTHARVAVSNHTHAAKLSGDTINVLLIEDLPHIVDDNITLPLPARDQLAYVIYTSGSTGKPKGVMIGHGSLLNLVNWHTRTYGLSGASRATAVAGIGFDAFGWEVWPYLSNGSSVYCVDDQTRLSAPSFVDLIVHEQITHCFVSTALIYDFVNATRHKTTRLQYVLTGGDKLLPIDSSGLNYTLVNNYGPTENTVVTTYYPLSGKDAYTTPPIGMPVSNTAVYILNADLQLAPVMVAGELFIAGSSLARGYLNQPELTAERFIKNHFDTGYGDRMYRTGDIARWLPGGVVQYLGRTDDQVKIRGYRIELGEVENVMKQSKLVEHALVLAKDDGHGNKRLVGYVVPSQPGDFNKDALNEHLRSLLPDYMVPALVIPLDKMPLTANGKIDKDALPDAPAADAAAKKSGRPQSQMELQLVDIWKDLLELDEIDPDDNFFELGGHSLLAIKLITAIKNKLLLSVPIQVIFQFSTISSLSRYLELQMPENTGEKSSGVFELVEL